MLQETDKCIIYSILHVYLLYATSTLHVLQPFIVLAEEYVIFPASCIKATVANIHFILNKIHTNISTVKFICIYSGRRHTSSSSVLL